MSAASAVAKSLIVFEVMPFEADQAMDELANKILGLSYDGLQWRTDYKLVEVAYGLKKIQIGCIIEDTKVSIDDILEKIQSWEDEVRAVDILSYQKV